MVCDILYFSFSTQPLEGVQRQHGPALLAVSVLYEIADNLAVLSQFGYLQAQIAALQYPFQQFCRRGGFAASRARQLGFAARCRQSPQNSRGGAFHGAFLFLSRQFLLQ